MTESPPKQSPNRKPTRSLPTPRIGFGKQMEILRAFAVGSGTTGKPVNNTELAALTKLNVSTASFNNVFYADNGLIARSVNGYVAAEEVVAFHRMWAFDPAKAPQKLAPILRQTWFGECVLREIGLKARSESDIIAELSILANAGTDYTPSVKLLLDYLEAAGLVEREGGLVREGPTARSSDAPRAVVSVPVTDAPPIAPSPPKAAPSNPVIASFKQTPEGAISFSVNVHVDMRELATWSPESVAAFFHGVAQVISAQKMVERQMNK